MHFGRGPRRGRVERTAVTDLAHYTEGVFQELTRIADEVDFDALTRQRPPSHTSELIRGYRDRWRALAADVTERADQPRPSFILGAQAVTGVLAAAATNPYLTPSMEDRDRRLNLALDLAMTAGAIAGRTPRPGPVRTMRLQLTEFLAAEA